MATKEELSDVAQKVIDDPDYARTVLEGNDHQEIRQALAKDLASEGDGEAEVEGFLNPQPLPPRWNVLVSRWSTISFVNLRFFLVR